MYFVNPCDGHMSGHVILRVTTTTRRRLERRRSSFYPDVSVKFSFPAFIVVHSSKICVSASRFVQAHSKLSNPVDFSEAFVEHRNHVFP